MTFYLLMAAMTFYLLMAAMTCWFVASSLPDDTSVPQGLTLMFGCAAIWPLFWAAALYEKYREK